MKRIRIMLAAIALTLGVGAAGMATAGSAQAYPWDPHVQVWFNASACVGSPSTWGWYSTGDGESGWVRWNSGYQGWFDLYHVPTSGSVTRISWGLPGRTCVTRFFNITRPIYGNVKTLGWIG